MNLSRKWLNEFVSVEANDKDFAEAMTLSGSKVELTHDLGAEISNVVVGRILSMERHPDSDHMWVCQLDVGKAEPVHPCPCPQACRFFGTTRPPPFRFLRQTVRGSRPPTRRRAASCL